MSERGGWITHLPTGNGRSLPSDTPVEAILRGVGVCRNMAGNFDNWRWREHGHGSVQAYRLISKADLPL
jgi:hypothetical protein